LVPLWGAVVGVIGAEIFNFGIPALAVAIFWMAAAWAERVYLGLARSWILSSGIAACWFFALRHLDSTRVLPTAVVAHTISRAGAIALAWVSRPAASGFQLSSRLTTPLALLSLAEGVAACLLAGIRSGVLLIAASYLMLRLVQEWCYKRRGGMDATGFTASQAALELLTLLVSVTQ
jgi:hypothetical protein